MKTPIQRKMSLLWLMPRLCTVAGIGLLAVFAAARAQSSGDGGPHDVPRPAGSQSNPTAEQPVLRAYHVGQADLDNVVTQLQQTYPPSTGVRVAPDARTGRILVHAPVDVQTAVAATVNRLTPAAPDIAEVGLSAAQGTQTAPIAVPGRPGAAGTVTRRLNTSGVSWRDLAVELQRLTGGRVLISAADESDTVRFALPAAGGRQVVLTADRTSDTMTAQGPRDLVDAWSKVIGALTDRTAGPSPTSHSQLVALRDAKPANVLKAVHALQTGVGPARDASARRSSTQLPRSNGDLISMLFQPAGQPEPTEDDPFADDPPNDEVPPPDAATDAEVRPGDDAAIPPSSAAGGLEDPGGGFVGSVQIEFIEGLDVVVVRGHRRDVQRIIEIINQIEQLSSQTEPAIEILPLKHVDSEAMAELVIELYAQVLSSRHGRVSITPLVKPNSLLLIGRPEGTDAVGDLVSQLDRPVPPSSQFRVFQLSHASAVEAQETISEFYDERGGLGARINVVADYRSNALIVQAGPRDLVEIQRLIEGIDVPDSRAVNEVRVFKLQNALAEDLAPILEEAIIGDESRRGSQAGPGAGGSTAGRRSDSQMRSTMLTFQSLDAEGKRLLKSGIMHDVRVTAEARTNSLVITGPAESMPLLSALVEQLDRLPIEEAQIKVFTIVNGDALNLAEMLQELFGAETAQGQVAIQTAAAGADSSLVPLRFSVDERTNSIISSGSGSDLTVVEAILLRLDESDVRQRENTVFQLLNSPAADVAEAINEFLRSQRQLQEIAPETVSPFEQIEREVIVVPEPVTNSLIISATPRYFEEIMTLVEELDRRPPMVLIQVVIAEVALRDIEEFGVEFGLQDSLLFDRGVATDVINPGFNFNNGNPLGNSSAAASQATRSGVAGQALSNFATGRANADLGYGGLVLSAGSESVNVLLRALQDDSRLDVLSRPQVMTLDNQSAFIQVGSQVPRVTSSQQSVNGTINNTTLDDVGLILGVTPRISPDGMVVMEIDATKSKLGPIEEGIPISVSIDGEVLRSPQIDTTRALTTISARDGQTVILGGLITKNTARTERRVPYIGDIPVLGHLFRYDKIADQRTELLIILTPHVVREDEDVEWTKEVESERMHWCLGDVVRMHGDAGLRVAPECADGAQTMVVYPDVDPTGTESMHVHENGPIHDDVRMHEDPHTHQGAPEPERIPATRRMPAPANQQAPPTRPDRTDADNEVRFRTAGRPQRLDRNEPVYPHAAESRSTVMRAEYQASGYGERMPPPDERPVRLPSVFD